MDKQHRRLVEIANNVVEAMRSGIGRAAVEENMQALVEYMQTHFSDEEAFMEEHGEKRQKGGQEKRPNGGHLSHKGGSGAGRVCV